MVHRQDRGRAMERPSVNALAHHLLSINAGRADRVAPELVALVAEDMGLPPPSLDHQWPTDVAEAIREVLRCAASDDLTPLSRQGGRFERLGLEAARAGLAFDQLAAGIRLAGRRLQTHVHRAMLEGDALDDTEAALELLGRVGAAVEAVVLGARRGYDLAGDGPGPLGERSATGQRPDVRLERCGGACRRGRLAGPDVRLRGHHQPGRPRNAAETHHGAAGLRRGPGGRPGDALQAPGPPRRAPRGPAGGPDRHPAGVARPLGAPAGRRHRPARPPADRQRADQPAQGPPGDRPRGPGGPLRAAPAAHGDARRIT